MRPTPDPPDTVHDTAPNCPLEQRRSAKFRFKNKLVSLDATVIDLCADMFPCAEFRRTKGAVKLHFRWTMMGICPPRSSSRRASGTR